MYVCGLLILLFDVGGVSVWILCLYDWKIKYNIIIIYSTSTFVHW